jgi:hypothetical protein
MFLLGLPLLVCPVDIGSPKIRLYQGPDWIEGLVQQSATNIKFRECLKKVIQGQHNNRKKRIDSEEKKLQSNGTYHVFVGSPQKNDSSMW